MVRAILGAILGYVVMTILVMVGIAAVWFGLGGEFAFEAGTWQASAGWSLLGLVTGFIAAVVGGLVAALVAPGGRAIKILMGFILVLGLLLAVMQAATGPKPPPAEMAAKTPAELTFMEAGQVAHSPTWYNFLIPFVGAAGVWVGGRLRQRGQAGG